MVKKKIIGLTRCLKDTPLKSVRTETTNEKIFLSNIH